MLKELVDEVYFSNEREELVCRWVKEWFFV